MHQPPLPPSTTSTRLLIIACSATKNEVTGLTPAWQLYDGVGFRVLKRALHMNRWPADLDVVILSAKYGLIEPDTMIEPYNQLMTEEHASRLQHSVHERLHRLVSARGYQELLVFAGKAYLRALRLAPVWYPTGLAVQVAEGGIGEKLKRLREWLG